MPTTIQALESFPLQDIITVLLLSTDLSVQPPALMTPRSFPAVTLDLHLIATVAWVCSPMVHPSFPLRSRQLVLSLRSSSRNGLDRRS